MAAVELAVARVGDLQDGQMKEVPFGERKILLSRVGGKYFATSHLCTHYKAPLVSGSISLDGRIICPWHGACFRVQTGDIEDAPATDALTSYKVRIDQDQVFVTASDEDLKTARRVPTMCRRSPNDSRTFVIVGGGAAAWGAVETLRSSNFAGRIVVISKEPYRFIDRTKLSKGVDVKVDKILIRPDAFYQDLDVEFVLGVEATRLDLAGKKVHVSTNQEIGYDKLLLATGGTPRNFWPDKTATMKNVVVVRTIADGDKLTLALAGKQQANVIVVGSSFIGMEAAAALAKTCKVSVIGMEKVPFERVLGEKIGAAMQKLHETNGVKFFLQTTVQDFEAGKDGNCTAVILKTGQKLDCDLVILGAGVLPATEWLKGTLQLEKDGALSVEQNLRVIGQNDIYAAGDIAQYPYHLSTGSASHQHVRIEHWDVAIQQGRVAAANMANAFQQNFTLVPYFWTAQFGKSLRYCGHAFEFDDVIVDGDLNELKFAAYYTKGDQVLAVASLARDPIVSKSAELMRVGAMLSASDIRSGKSPLQVPTPAAATATAAL